MYYVYIIKSLKDQKYYIGSTSDVPTRLQFHNAGFQRSTKNRIPFILVCQSSPIFPVKNIKPYHQAVIDTIRYYDPDNLIICGTPTWSQDVDVAANDPLEGTNIGYSLHFYSGTHKQSLRDKARTALNKGIALMVTEFGTTNSTGNGDLYLDETNTWLTFLDENKISWCNWSAADKAEDSAALLPGSPNNGGWTNSQLTESGSYIRSEIRADNPWFH